MKRTIQTELAEERDLRLSCAGREMLFVDKKVSSSQNQHVQSISVVFEPGKEMMFIDS